MRVKRVLLGIFITALLVTIILVSIRAYYVAVALVAGVLLFGHREFWSLLTRRRLPPFDERVRGNIDKSIRNGFIFFALALAFLMLPFSTILISEPGTVHVLGGLLLSGGAVYLLSYLFYERAEPRLNEKWLKMLRMFLLVGGVSAGSFIISVFLHNAIYGLFIQWFGADFWDRVGMPDEPVFFFISVFIAPLGFAVGITGGLVIFLKGVFSRVS
ncbi:MAG TPA: hypothetical protein G4O12_09000 [Dehalococcoidia bacterium]|nr:hypothetical protein [Dehalococcoidia bacterium]